jgi:hypothetical protein
MAGETGQVQEITLPDGIKGNEELTQAFLAAGKAFKTPDDTGATGATGEADPQPIIGGAGDEPGPEGMQWGVFGKGFDSQQKVLDAFKKRGTDFSQAQQNIQKITVEKQELENKLSASMQSNIDDPVLYRLNSIKKNSPDDFDFYRQFAFDQKVNPLVLLRMNFLKDNPEYKDKPEDVDLYLKNEYGLDLEPLTELNAEDYDEKEVLARKTEIVNRERQMKINLMKMETGANKVRKTMQESFDKVELPASLQDPEKIKQAAEKAKAVWGAIADRMLEAFKQTEVFVQGKDDGGKYKDPTVFMNYDVDASEKVKYKDHLVDFAIKQGLDLSKPEHINVAANFLQMRYMIDNQAKINHVLMTHARGLTEDEWIDRSSNPYKPIKPKDVLPDATTDPLEKSRQEAMKAEGLDM